MNLLKAHHERDRRFVTRILTDPVTVAHETVRDETKASPTVFDALPDCSICLYRRKRPTETAVLKVITDVLRAADRGQVSCQLAVHARSIGCI